MLNARYRLTKTRDFNLLIKHGRWANSQFLDLKYLNLAKNQHYFPPKEDPEKFKKQLKIGVAVGLKVSKAAVKRNRARRQISEAVRLLLKSGQVLPGYYLLLVARKDLLTKSYAEISQEVKLLLKKAKVLSVTTAIFNFRAD